MILIKATPVEEYNGLTIAKSDVTGCYDVYAEHGYMWGGFNSLQGAKDSIDGEEVVSLYGLDLKKENGVWNYWHDDVYGWCQPVPNEIAEKLKGRDL